MKKWIFLAFLVVLGACTADYDTFDTSDYRALNDISVKEQDYSPAIYSKEHRVEFDLVEVPESLKTWDSVTFDAIDISHFASLHLVAGDVDDFPTDSLGLDSLSKKVKYSNDEIKVGDKIRVPSSHVVYVVIVSESGKKSIWKFVFNIPNVEPESSSSPKSSSSADAKSSSSEKAPSSSTNGASSSSTDSNASSNSNDSSASVASSSGSGNNDATSSSSESGEPSSAESPKILALSIAGKAAVIDEESKSIHVDDLAFRTDLTALELSAMELSEGATASVTVGEAYDFGAGVQVKVTNEKDESVTYSVKAGYQLPGSNFNSWNKDGDLVLPDSVWGNANTMVETTKKVSPGSMIGAEIRTTSALIKMASGSLYTAVFNPNGVGTLSMASSKTWPDGNELLDFGKPFAARPEYMEVKFSYDGKGDSCDIYILLENRTGDKNVNRKSTDVNTLVASAWFRSTKADNSGRENPDVVSVSEPDENGMRTLRLKLKYGEPLEGSPIENSSTFDTKLKSSNKSAINNGLVQGTGEEPVTHIRVVFASSADGNHYEGVEGATLIVDDLKLIY